MDNGAQDDMLMCTKASVQAHAMAVNLITGREALTQRPTLPHRYLVSAPMSLRNGAAGASSSARKYLR